MLSGMSSLLAGVACASSGCVVVAECRWWPHPCHCAAGHHHCHEQGWCCHIIVTCTEAMSKKFKVKQQRTFAESASVVVTWRWLPHLHHCTVDTHLSVFVSRFNVLGGGEINKTKSRGKGVPALCASSVL